jgi:hypothetical protein
MKTSLLVLLFVGGCSVELTIADTSPPDSASPTCDAAAPSSAPSSPAVSPIPLDAGAIDATAPCVPCAAALAGDAAFEDGSLGRVYDGACNGSGALWVAFYDWACATAKPCHLTCIDSLCLTGFPGGNCAACIAQHVTEPPYDDCKGDD